MIKRRTCSACGMKGHNRLTCLTNRSDRVSDALVAISEEANRDALSALSEANREEAERMVNHPSHYTAHPSGVECITVSEHFNFNIGNAIKYLWRAGLKGATDTDLAKARWYVDREIARLAK